MPSLSINPDSVEKVRQYRTLQSENGAFLRRSAYPSSMPGKNSYKLIWDNATPADVATLKAFLTDTSGGRVPFTWTAPEAASSSTYRIVDQTVTFNFTNSAAASISFTIEELH